MLNSIKRYYYPALVILPVLSLLMLAIAQHEPPTINIPDPKFDSSAVQTSIAQVATVPAGQQTAVFAGGCFWGVEAVFEHVRGVSDVVSGYSGGSAATANYHRVGTGQTGHAEAVQITYDPTQISYGQLLKIYFSVAHDPTQVDRQGPDIGSQYRSAIFFTNKQQQEIAQTYIRQLNQTKIFHQPIATQVIALNGFYPAEDYHQDFIKHNPNYPYVVTHDLPKLHQLQARFPELYQ